MLLTTCEACKRGDHANHREVIRAPYPGVLGGEGCGCKGECFATPWSGALVNAQRGIKRAADHRRRIFQGAYDAGLSLAVIGGVVGLSATGVHKIIGRQRAKDSQAVLDSPTADSDRGTQPMSVRRTAKVWMCPEHGAMTLAYPTDRTPLCHLYGVGTCDRPCELVEMAESEVIQT